MVAHACDPSSWEAEEGYLKFKASLVHSVRQPLSLNNNNNNNKNSKQIIFKPQVL